MRIAFCIFKMTAFGGLQRDCLRLMEAVRDRGHEVHVFTRSWQCPAPNGITVHVLAVRAFTNHGKNAAFVATVLPRLHGFDCVVGFNRMPGLDVYFAGDYCFVADAKKRHGPWFQFTKRYRAYAAFENAVYGCEASTHSVLLTRAEQHVIQQHYHTPDDRFTVLAPGIASDRVKALPGIREQLRAQWNIREDDVLFLSIGSSFHRKGVDRSLAAIAALPEALRARAHFIVLGEDAQLARLRKRYKHSSRVHFLGGREDAMQFLFAADVLLHPARRETAGMVLIEALTAHLPVIVSGACGYAEWVQKAHGGIVLPEPFDFIAYRDALVAMMTCDRHVVRQAVQHYLLEHPFIDWVHHFVPIIENYA